MDNYKQLLLVFLPLQIVEWLAILWLARDGWEFWLGRGDHFLVAAGLALFLVAVLAPVVILLLAKASDAIEPSRFSSGWGSTARQALILLLHLTVGLLFAAAALALDRWVEYDQYQSFCTDLDPYSMGYGGRCTPAESFGAHLNNALTTAPVVWIVSLYFLVMGFRRLGDGDPY